MKGCNFWNLLASQTPSFQRRAFVYRQQSRWKTAVRRLDQAFFTQVGLFQKRLKGSCACNPRLNMVTSQPAMPSFRRRFFAWGASDLDQLRALKDLE